MIRYNCYIKNVFDKNVKMDEYLSLLLQFQYGTFFGSTSKRNNENQITFFESRHIEQQFHQNCFAKACQLSCK